MNTPTEPPARGDPADGGERGVEEIIRAIRAAIPTSRHARMLFDMVLAGLGDDAMLQTADKRTRFTLHRRDRFNEAFCPTPLLKMGTKGRLGHVINIATPWADPVEPPPRPGTPPALRNLGPGEIEIHRGPQRITVTYGEDGRWMETSRSRWIGEFADVVDVLSTSEASPVDLLADYVLGIDPGQYGPGRVLYPVPIPGGIDWVWLQGLRAIRRAFFENLLPTEAGWAVADGFVGTALAWAASREEALEVWRGKVEETRPKPLEAPPLPADLPEEGTRPTPDGHGVEVTIRGPTADVEMPEPVPENTPAVVIPVAPLSGPEHVWGKWVRLLGPRGTTYPALVRQDPDGLTLVGGRLARRVDLDEIDAQLERAPSSSGLDLGTHRKDYDCQTSIYLCLDEETHEPIEPRLAQTQIGYALDTGGLDGEQLYTRVLRQRWLRLE